jgi:hypothetical protein
VGFSLFAFLNGVNDGVSKGKASDNSDVLAPMPALKLSIWSVFAHSRRRLVDEGWIDAATAVAPNGLDYATRQAESCGVDSGGVTSAISVEFDPARRDLDS